MQCKGCGCGEALKLQWGVGRKKLNVPVLSSWISARRLDQMSDWNVGSNIRSYVWSDIGLYFFLISRWSDLPFCHWIFSLPFSAFLTFQCSLITKICSKKDHLDILRTFHSQFGSICDANMTGNRIGQIGEDANTDHYPAISRENCEDDNIVVRTFISAAASLGGRCGMGAADARTTYKHTGRTVWIMDWPQRKPPFNHMLYWPPGLFLTLWVILGHLSHLDQNVPK